MLAPRFCAGGAEEHIQRLTTAVVTPPRNVYQWPRRTIYFFVSRKRTFRLSIWAGRHLCVPSGACFQRQMCCNCWNCRQVALLGFAGGCTRLISVDFEISHSDRRVRVFIYLRSVLLAPYKFWRMCMLVYVAPPVSAS